MFWAAKKLDEVTRSGYDIVNENRLHLITFRVYDHSKALEYGDLINGNLMSNCPMPCLASKVPFQNDTLNSSIH